MEKEPFAAKFDAREYPPRDKHRLIFETFDGLRSGTAMELTNDHDPKPLFYQFQAERPDQFTWEYLEEGPTEWRVSIGKV